MVKLLYIILILSDDTETLNKKKFMIEYKIEKIGMTQFEYCYYPDDINKLT